MTPQHDPTSIGNLSKIFCRLTDADVDTALALQKKDKLLLGQALVQCGKLQHRDVVWLLQKQDDLRNHPGARDVGKVLDYACELTSSLCGQL